jgi:hypothetical protein
VRGVIGDFRLAHPTTAELVIEICVGSHDYDHSKLRAYAGAGVKECWLVLAPEKQIEVHRQPQGEQSAERAVHGAGRNADQRGGAGLHGRVGPDLRGLTRAPVHAVRVRMAAAQNPPARSGENATIVCRHGHDKPY